MKSKLPEELSNEVPQTKWGKIAMGKKTRHRKATDKFIVRKRTK